MRNAIARVAERNDLDESWLNDGVKGYLVEHKQSILFDFPNLKIFVPEPDYLLAMKAISARSETFDPDDVKTLVDFLGLTSPNQVFEIVEKYYPSQQIKPATQYFIQELFQK